MKTAPKQKPPSTRCSYQGIGVAPDDWKTSPMTVPPRNTLSIVFQLAMSVQRRMTAPMAMAMTDVSPTEPGISPVIMSWSEALTVTPCPICPSGVAMVKPSGSV